MKRKTPQVHKGSATDIKQRRVLVGVMDGKSMKKAMLDEGYSPSYANSSTNLVRTDSWQKLLTEIDDSAITDRLTDILNDTDKRASLTAADMLLKLKDKYPSNKTKTINYQVDMDGLTKE